MINLYKHEDFTRFVKKIKVNFQIFRALYIWFHYIYHLVVKCFQVWQVKFNPDSNRLVSVGEDCAVNVYSIAVGLNNHEDMDQDPDD